ncbi:MAG: NTP transferase domain-containing protein [Acidobacteria bacterium]|nr:NTP transferase domain-containing protein [Acidobacteriota bacterium]
MRPRRMVVLAAGFGSRLRRRGTEKVLVRLGGLSLLERSIVAAHEAGFDEVVVVTGHQGDRVARHALEVSRRRGVAVVVAHNERYRDGNGLSVLAAREAVGEAPFALVMADHVFAPAFLRRLRETAVAPGEVVAAIDRSLGRAVGVDAADAMKVRLIGDQVEAIAKTLTDYDAFDVGAFVCSPALFDAVKEASANGDSTLAGAIQVVADAGAARALELVDDEWWFDVDTSTDYRRGNRFLLRGTGKALDGAVAARLNRAVSQRLVTPALLRAIPTITPNQITLVAFAAAAAAAAAFVAHAPLLAAVLVTLASVLDGSDGEVARLTHRSSRFGGFFDAVLDRVADGLLFTGAAVYLATSNDLANVFGSAQVSIVVVVSGVTIVGHLLVSYTTAKAATDLDHHYHGALVAGGRGRDLRLLIVTLGALGAAIHAGALFVAMAVIGVLSMWIISVRLRASWWAEGPGSNYLGVRAVAFDFDGTVANTMGVLTDLATSLLTAEFGLARSEATRRYLATAGDDFRTQLDVITAGHLHAHEVAAWFESEKEALIDGCRPFADAGPAFARLRRAGVPILVCSSTRSELVQRFCRRHELSELATAIDGWRPDHPKAEQLAEWAALIGVAPSDVLFVGDAMRDAAIAEAAGLRFIGLARPGHPDSFAGSGIAVVTSLAAVAHQVVRARRLPVSVGNGYGYVTRSTPEESPLAPGPVEVADVVRPQEVRKAVDDAHRRDRAVGDRDVAVDFRPRTERPGDGGPHHRVVGEHHGSAGND